MSLPLTILGGYLGAGKTTLINRLLGNANGRRLTILVNDFGAINIDAGLIAAHDGDTLTLTNGCACCQLRDDMVEQLNQLAGQSDAPDQIIVEASGAGEPARLAYLGYGIDGLQLDAVWVAADAATIGNKVKDKFVGKLVRRQIEQADFILLTKTDLTPDDGARALAQLHKLTPAPIAETRDSDIEKLIFGVTPNHAPRHAPQPRVSELDMIDADALFDQMSFTSPTALPLPELEQLLRDVGGQLARAKGHTGTHRLQLVGDRFGLMAAESRSAELVFIAAKGACDFAALEQRLRHMAGRDGGPIAQA
jgi:G3E family GTPase